MSTRLREERGLESSLNALEGGAGAAEVVMGTPQIPPEIAAQENVTHARTGIHKDCILK